MVAASVSLESLCVNSIRMLAVDAVNKSNSGHPGLPMGFSKYNGKVMDIIDYDPEVLDIYSREVLRLIIANQPGWEELLPEGIAEIIKEKELFRSIKELPNTKSLLNA